MLIVIEGCVGAGKSTVAKGLSVSRNSRVVLEDFESNPFLRAFYENPIDNATETEFAFLLLHFHQLKRLGAEAEASEIIADFHLGKDLLYADLNLRDARIKRLFGQMYDFCSEQIPPAGLMIFLSASTELLIKRIWARRRDFEVEIDPVYYAKVNAAYEEFFERYSGKKIKIPMDEWDFVVEPNLYGRLASLVDKELRIK